MKKTLLCLAVAIPMLTGCVKALDELGADTWITTEEQGYILANEAANYSRGLISTNNNTAMISAENFREIWWNMAESIKRRRDYPEDVIAKVKKAPFCDILREVQTTDYILKTRVKGAITLAETYQEVTGKSLEQACGMEPDSIPVARTVQTDRTPKGEPELAPETYGLMIDAARTCERARISLMSYPANHVFTKNDYNKVMNLVNDCKRFELETTINGK